MVGGHQPLPKAGRIYGLPLLLGGLLIGLTILAYWPGMKAGFYFDDLVNIVDVRALHWTEWSVGAVQRVAGEATMPSRFVSNLSFALNHLHGGLDPSGYHWTNLVIHLLVGVSLLWVAVLLAGEGAQTTLKLEKKLFFALAACSIFLLHPLNIQAVTYVVQRMTVLSTLFVLLALGCYISARGRQGRQAVAWFAAGMICWLLALGNKEIAVVLPLVLVIYEACFYPVYWRDRIRRISQRVGRWRLLTMVLGLVVLVGIGVGQLYYTSDLIRWNELLPGRDYSGVQRMLTEARIQFFYWGLFFWPEPSRLNLEHDFSLSISLFQPWTTAFAVLGWVAIATGVWWLARRYPRYGFPLLGYGVFHLLESGPINLELVFEHRMYLPMAFLVFLITNLLVDYCRGYRMISVALVLMLMPLSAATFERNQTWSEPLVFLRDCATKSPNKFRPWYNLGSELGKTGQFAEAELALNRALNVRLDHSMAHNQLGNVYLLTGRQPQAFVHYQYAVQYGPKNLEAIFNLATQYDARGERAEAVRLFEQFIKLAPPYFAEARRRAQLRLRMLR